MHGPQPNRRRGFVTRARTRTRSPIVRSRRRFSSVQSGPPLSFSLSLSLSLSTAHARTRIVFRFNRFFSTTIRTHCDNNNVCVKNHTTKVLAPTNWSKQTTKLNEIKMSVPQPPDCSGRHETIINRLRTGHTSLTRRHLIHPNVASTSSPNVGIIENTVKKPSAPHISRKFSVRIKR